MWLNKFRFDVTHGNIATTIESILELTVEARLTTLRSGYHPLAVVEMVINENPTLFDLKGLRIPPDDEAYSVLIKLEDFGLFYLKRRVLLTVLDDDDEEFDFIWKNIGGVVTPQFFKGQLRTDRAFFWSAPTEEIERISARFTGDRAATILRDRLGLHTAEKGQRLVRIDIPTASLVGKRLRAPTTLDSGANPTFVPSDSGDAYGRTLNLTKIVRDVKEIVGQEIPFDGNFTVLRVGIVTSNVPVIAWAGVESLVT
jgi:hypothetical protein